MDDIRYFPVTSSFVFNHYYPFGNTPPDDLLQSITTDTPRPDVLLLGCGDLRSCLYTLWNNFDHRHARRFKGVHFVLNDISAAVLARNIIFLYLCTQMPLNCNDNLRWVASFWAIWYCHELLPHHKKILMNTLSNLLRWSSSIKSWNENTDNSLRLLVQFSCSTHLSQVHEVFKMWYNSSIIVKEMRNNRSKHLQSCTTLHDPLHQLFNYFGLLMLKNFSKSERATLKHDVELYYQNGFVFAEEAFGLPTPEPTLVNSTFFEGPEGDYNLPRDFTPYHNFFFTYQFSPSNLENLCYSDFPLTVKDDMFKHRPLLANSVQQFSIWVRSCAEILSQTHHDIVFTFQCCDALEFCQQLRQSPLAGLPNLFDVIYSSNLLDHTAPPSLILLALQILKPDCLLFTSIAHYSCYTNTCAEYLKRAYGLDCKHFQLLCGVRCVGYENEYSDIYSVRPAPCNYNIDTLLKFGVKSLVWQHVTATLLKQPTEQDLSFMWNALSTCIVQLLTFDDSVHNNFSCTGTIVLLLQSFMSRFDEEIHSFTSYKFWEPLCCLLLKQRSLQAFLISLQTQALLHGIHLHLTASEADCPLCKKQPIFTAVIQQSITVPVTPTDNFATGGRGSLTVAIYATSLCNRIDKWKRFNPNCISGVHIVDSIAASIKDKILYADFYIPASFSQGGYCKALLCHDKFIVINHEVNNTIHKMHFFSKLIQKQPVHQPSLSVLGTTIQHSGDEHHFETIITLNDSANSALSNCKLTTQQCNGRTVRIVIGNYYTDISYPYTIKYGKQLSVELFWKSKKIIITAHRTRHSLHEQPVFIINPDNMLSLPVMPLSKSDTKSFCELSYGYNLIPNVECHLKETILSLFAMTSKSLFTLVHDVDGTLRVDYLIAVLNRVFDMHHKTPAIDMLFFDCSENQYNYPINGECNSIKFTSDAEYQLARKVFDYFSRCTATTKLVPKENITYQYLVKHKIERLFTHRAVIYPLYPNADERMASEAACQSVFPILYGNNESPEEMEYWFDKLKAIINEDRCSYCQQHSEDLLSCSRCHLVQYCHNKCQKKHWKTHKPHCKPPPQ
ncbi:uncharacterized protein [Dysidea avara]|uniref:uncharacterized protein n=1 Tax=Dysidea avara TaxID=196820 RepID=UPI003331E6E7